MKVSKEEALNALKLYEQIENEVYKDSERVWDIYATVKQREYERYYKQPHKIRKYHFDRIAIEDSLLSSIDVVYEDYCCGDSDYIYLPLDYFFEENLEEFLVNQYNEYFAKLDAEKAQREEEAKQKQKIEAEQKAARDITRLKNLIAEYPEQAKELIS